MANNILNNISICNKYVFTAITPGGENHELICFEGDPGFEKDFLLNYKQSSFQKILSHSETKIDTKNPIGCVDMRPRPLPGKTADASPQDKNAKGVSFIGGSYVSGEGVTGEKRFPFVAGRLCRSNNNCDITDAAFYGSNIKQIYEKTFKKAVAGGAGEIFYVITPTDMPVKINSPEFFPTPRAGAFLSPMLPARRKHFPLLEYVLYKINVRFEKARETVWLKAGYSHMNYAGTEELKKYIRKMKNESEASGKRFSCAIFPYMTGEEYGAYAFRETHLYISDILKSERIPFTDISKPILSGDYTGKQVSRCDYRPGPAAHEIAGNSIYNFLTKSAGKTRGPKETLPGQIKARRLKTSSQSR